MIPEATANWLVRVAKYHHDAAKTNNGFCPICKNWTPPCAVYLRCTQAADAIEAQQKTIDELQKKVGEQ